MASSNRTLGDIAEFVTENILHDNELHDTALEFAKRVYLTYCGKVPFNELQSISGDIATVASQQAYTLDDALDDGLSNLAGIVSIQLSVSSTQKRKLRRSHQRLFEMIGTSNEGQPAVYTRWNNVIRFLPIPDSASYTFRLIYWSYPELDEDNLADTLVVTPQEWDELFEWETLYRMYNGPLDQPDRAMALVQPSMLPRQASPTKVHSYDLGIIPRLRNELLQTVQGREAIDEEFSVNPIRRSYTNTRYGW